MSQHGGEHVDIVKVFRILLKGKWILLGGTMLSLFMGVYVSSSRLDTFKLTAVVDPPTLTSIMSLNVPYNEMQGFLKDINYDLKKEFSYRYEYIRNPKSDYHEQKISLRNRVFILFSRLLKDKQNIKEFNKRYGKVADIEVSMDTRFYGKIPTELIFAEVDMIGVRKGDIPEYMRLYLSFTNEKASTIFQNELNTLKKGLVTEGEREVERIENAQEEYFENLLKYKGKIKDIARMNLNILEKNILYSLSLRKSALRQLKSLNIQFSQVDFFQLNRSDSFNVRIVKSYKGIIILSFGLFGLLSSLLVIYVKYLWRVLKC